MIYLNMPTRALNNRWIVGRSLPIVVLLSVRYNIVRRSSTYRNKANKADKANKAQHNRNRGPLDANTF